MMQLHQINKHAKAAWIAGIYTGVANAEAWREDPEVLARLERIASIAARIVFAGDPNAVLRLIEVLEFFDQGYTDHVLSELQSGESSVEGREPEIH